MIVDVEAHMMPLPGPRFHVTRDLVLFAVGLGGVLHEMLLSNGERPTLLLLFAAMMGLPLYLHERKNGNGK